MKDMRPIHMHQHTAFGVTLGMTVASDMGALVKNCHAVTLRR
jgi:hypothetical protein